MVFKTILESMHHLSHWNIYSKLNLTLFDLMWVSPGRCYHTLQKYRLEVTNHVFLCL